MSSRRIILNCDPGEINRERRGFYEALQRTVAVEVAQVREVTATFLLLADGRRIAVDSVAGLWHLDPPLTLIPEGLPSARIPTLWMHMDSAVAFRWRMRWSDLFDGTCLCAWHTPLDPSRHRCFVTTQPYAADRAGFDMPASTARDLDVGWVGQIRGDYYRKRARIIPQVAARYRVNADWSGRIAESEVLSIYRRAKIVVNIQRDDFPAWYNVRCFEALAAGALLFAEKGTSLTEAGFRDGEHFVTYGSDEDLFAKIDRYLRDDHARQAIANAGHELTRAAHTYDVRVAELLDLCGRDARETKPGRRPLSSTEAAYLYGTYYAKRTLPARARPHLQTLLRQAPAHAAKLLPYYCVAAWRTRCRRH